MLYVTANREDMLTWLPKGGALAEIGVFAGAWSRRLLEVCKPTALHLVDVWKWTYYDWNNPPESERGNMENFRVWAKGLDTEYDGGHPDKMLDRFHSRLVAIAGRDNRLSVHRAASVDAAKKLPNGSLDCVYVDADHRYDAVLADLYAWAPKVKPGGLIWGDDFLDDENRKDGLYGTVQAVTTFCRRGEFKPLMVVGPSACQYVLYRESSPYVEAFVANAINSDRHIIELNDMLIGRFFQKEVRSPNRSREIASFL